MTMIVLAVVLAAATGRRPAASWRRSSAAKGGRLSPSHLTWPTIVSEVGRGDRGDDRIRRRRIARRASARRRRPRTARGRSRSAASTGFRSPSRKAAASSLADCAGQRRLERMVRRPPDFRGKVVAVVAQRLDATGNRIALPIDAAFGLKPCCSACFQKVVKSGGSTTPVTISRIGVLEGGDLRGEIVGQVLVAAGIGQLVAGLARAPAGSRRPGRPRRCRRRRWGRARRPICWSRAGPTCW